jgi:F-type H+-transporting ATPase subunit b
MELITPDIGLMFWMLVSFTTVLLVLKKFAWKPILRALKSREDSIDSALKSADKAKKELKDLKANHEKMIEEAKKERDKVMAEARDIKNQIIADAKKQAADEANKLIESAKESIEREKAFAFKELKNQIANVSVEIAEKILKQKLESDKKQEELVDSMIKEIKMN